MPDKGRSPDPEMCPNLFSVPQGADLFISVWNLHRSPYLWENPNDFNPQRFSETFKNDDFKGAWAGYRSGSYCTCCVDGSAS